jgi:hypothetical protein
MLRAYVYQHVAVLPLNAYAVTTLHATGVTFFNPARVATRTGQHAPPVAEKTQTMPQFVIGL